MNIDAVGIVIQALPVAGQRIRTIKWIMSGLRDEKQGTGSGTSFGLYTVRRN